MFGNRTGDISIVPVFFIIDFYLIKDDAGISLDFRKEFDTEEAMWTLICLGKRIT